MIEFDEREMKDIIIYQILFPSLQELYKVDYDNIRWGVSERNICARLAHHMENILRDYDIHNYPSFFDGYFVDVEYNRMSNGNLKQYENSEHRPKYMVSDLLIQTRDDRRNLLAVEMKRKGNNKNINDDKKRLISLVSPSSTSSPYNCVHDTLLGAFIQYSKDYVNIELFENKNGQGAPCGFIILGRNNLNHNLIIYDENIF